MNNVFESNVFCDHCGKQFILDQNDKYEDTINNFVSMEVAIVSRKFGELNKSTFELCYACFEKSILRASIFGSL